MTQSAIYVRISSDSTGEGLGVQRQEEACRELAERLEWEVVEVFTDNDISAYSGKPRPAYLRLLSDMETGKVTRVLAWHTDRLHRSPVELEKFAEVAIAQNVQTHTVQAGPLDLSSASGLMVARILGATARYESDHKAARLKAKHAQLRRDGVMVGQRTFGWMLDDSGRLTGDLDPVESELIRDAVRIMLAGGSPFKIALDWNLAGVTTTRGGRWTHANLKILLKNPKIAGLRAHRGEVVIDQDGHPVVGKWEPIISVEKWQRLVAIIEAKKTGRSGAVKHLLGGLIRCACGGVMYGAAMPRQENVYACHDCRSAIAQSKVETPTLSAVASAILMGRQESSHNPNEAHSALAARLAGIAEARARLVAAVEVGALDLKDVGIRKSALDAEEVEVGSALDRALLTGATGDVFASIRAELFKGKKVAFIDAVSAKAKINEAFRALDMDRQRALIRSSFSITVRPGRGSDRVKVKNLGSEADTEM